MRRDGGVDLDGGGPDSDGGAVDLEGGVDLDGGGVDLDGGAVDLEGGVDMDGGCRGKCTADAMGWLMERGRWTSEVPGVGIRARARLTQGSTQVQGSPMEITPLLLQDRDDPHNIRIQVLLELYLSLSSSSSSPNGRPPLRRCWAVLYRLAAQHTRLHMMRGAEAPISGFWSMETVSSRGGRLHSAAHSVQAAPLFSNSARL